MRKIIRRDPVKPSELIHSMNETYRDYLSDESGLVGHAESISFPESEGDILLVLEECAKNGTPMTVQGGLTGIVGAGVPEGGHILNLSRMNRIGRFEAGPEGRRFLTAEPGVTLMDLDTAVRKLRHSEALFWPPDPTEPSATLGGIVASGAQGISTGLYGPTERYIDSLRVLDFGGRVLTVEGGSEGYFGSEGMYGVVTDVRLLLSPKPAAEWGIGFFFPGPEDSFSFAERLKSMMPVPGEGDGGIAVAEYFDRGTIDLIQKNKAFMSSIKTLPDIPGDVTAMVYTEIHGPDEGFVAEIAEQLMEIAVECDSDPDRAWAVSGEGEIEKVRAFRHAAPESINLVLEERRREHPGILKSASDMTLPGEDFGLFYRRREKEIRDAGLEALFFGHITDNHLHINLLPRDPEEYERGQELLQRWAVESIASRGAAVTEHGVGKLKKKLLTNCLAVEEREKIAEKRREFDPAGRWNPGNGINPD